MLENLSKIYLYEIQSLGTEGTEPMEIYTKVNVVYGVYNYYHTVVVERCNKFIQGREFEKVFAHPGLACVTESNKNVRQLESTV